MELDPEYVLTFTVDAMDLTTGRNGLSTRLLVIGVSPRIPTGIHNLPVERDRVKAMSVVRLEIVKVMSWQSLATALQTHVPIGSDVLLDASTDKTPDCTFIKKSLKHDDARYNLEIIRKTKQVEISGLSERST